MTPTGERRERVPCRSPCSQPDTGIDYRLRFTANEGFADEKLAARCKWMAVLFQPSEWAGIALVMEIAMMVPVRFCPSTDTLDVLNGRSWICSYSGGKDSTALVTWIEWLRRVGLVRCTKPRLVLSDTGVEYPFLAEISRDIMKVLEESGWECTIVKPIIKERLYNRIFGIGNSPVHPGNRSGMRWCTRATKIDPMKRFSDSVSTSIVKLSGVRWGESGIRDHKLAAGGCAAGGECGLPQPGEGTYAPIIAWRTCKVVEWLSGEIELPVRERIADLLPFMRRLTEAYDIKQDKSGNLFELPPKTTALRFGCIGCPAITNEKITNSRLGRQRPEWHHLRRIYSIWQALYLRENRCGRLKDGKIIIGPIKMSARKRYFGELMDIQAEAGVVLVTNTDEAFIRDCWARNVYPRGWSAKDEEFDYYIESTPLFL